MTGRNELRTVDGERATRRRTVRSDCVVRKRVACDRVASQRVALQIVARDRIAPHRVAHSRFARRPAALIALASFAVASLACATRAAAHPLHTSVAELRLAPDGALSVSLRTFSDDFSAAVARATGTEVLRNHTVSDAAVTRYVREALQLQVAGSTIAWQLVSQRREGDVTLLELRSERPVATLSGARFSNRMLMEFHGDQVNLLKAAYAGRTFTTLFAQGAPPKTLP